MTSSIEKIAWRSAAATSVPRGGLATARRCTESRRLLHGERYEAMRSTPGEREEDYLCAGSLLAAPWKRTRYCPYPSSLSRSTGMNRSAAELMQ